MTNLVPAASLCIVLTVLGCGSAGRSVAGPAAHIGNWERELHELINLHRADQGLRPLQYSRRLSRIARDQSRAMASGRAAFSHEGLPDRLRRAQRSQPVLYMGENLLVTRAASEIAVRNALAGWLESSSHRHMVEGCFDRAGIGAAADGHGRVYFTQLYVLTPGAGHRCRLAHAAGR